MWKLSEYHLSWNPNPNVALIESQFYHKVAILKSEYCLIWNPDIDLLEKQFDPKVSVLKSEYCVTWNPDIALFGCMKVIQNDVVSYLYLSRAG